MIMAWRWRAAGSDSEIHAAIQRQQEPDLVTHPIELGWVRELRATDEQLDDFLFRRTGEPSDTPD